MRNLAEWKTVRFQRWHPITKWNRWFIDQMTKPISGCKDNKVFNRCTIRPGFVQRGSIDSNLYSIRVRTLAPGGRLLEPNPSTSPLRLDGRSVWLEPLRPEHAPLLWEIAKD